MESYKILIWLWQLKWLVYRKELIKSALRFSLSFFIFYLLSFIFYPIILLFLFAFIFLLFFQSHFFSVFSLFPFLLFIVLTSFFFFLLFLRLSRKYLNDSPGSLINWYLMINNFPMFFSLSTVTRPIFISAPLI